MSMRNQTFHRSQRTLLHSYDTPTTQFVDDFTVSHRQHKALHKDRITSAPEQQRFLQMRAKQHAYVEDAHMRELPPIDRIVAHQELLCEIRRDAHHLAPKPAETALQLDQRMAQRDAFLASRKLRHDDACEIFARSIDALDDECLITSQGANQAIQDYIEKSGAQALSLLSPLESEAESLAERSEAEIQKVKTRLEKGMEMRKQRIAQFQQQLEDSENWRKREATTLLLALVESLRHAGHVSHEEIEGLIEVRTTKLNKVLQERLAAARAIAGELMIATLEASKDYKKRWHAALTAWRRIHEQPQQETLLLEEPQQEEEAAAT